MEAMDRKGFAWNLQGKSVDMLEIPIMNRQTEEVKIPWLCLSYFCHEPQIVVNQLDPPVYLATIMKKSENN